MSRKEEYEWLKAHKICVSCRAATATRGTKCDECADKDLERRHRKLASMTDEEREVHRQKNKEYLRKRYEKRRKEGKCAACGKPVYKNHSRCYECYIKELRVGRELWNKKKKGYAELGKCRICGKDVVAGKKHCEEHLKQYQERMQKNSYTLNRRKNAV